MRRSQGQVLDNEAFTAVHPTMSAAESISPVPFVVPADLPVDSWQYRYLKRIVDLVGGFVLLALFLIPGLVIALAILISSPYPVFYSEQRVGRSGVPFRIWKFRSMRPHTPHRPHLLHWRMD